MRVFSLSCFWQRLPDDWLLKTIAWMLFVSCVFSSSACGFRLRGSVHLDAAYLPVYISDQHKTRAEIVRPLLNVLRDNGIDTTDTNVTAGSVIVILSENFSRKVSSVDRDGRAREFELRYLVEYQILDAQKQALASSDSVRINRNLRYDNAQVLAKSDEEEQLRRDMLLDAAQRLIQRMQGAARRVGT